MAIARVASLTVAIVVLVPDAGLSAIEYQIDPIATDLASVPRSDEAPVILADGSVLYMLDHRLMKGDGETSQVVYEATAESDIPPYSVRDVSFNSRGDFVALCRMRSRQATLVRWQEGQTTLLDRRMATSLGSADINDKGRVAYMVRSNTRLTQVILHDGTNSHAVARSETLSGLAFETPSLNNQGQIAVASYSGIHLIEIDGRRISISQVVSDRSLGGFDGVTLNDDGQIAFRVRRPETAIYIVEGGKLRKLVDTSSSFATLGLPCLNSGGQVAFHAVDDGGGEAIVVHTDGTHWTVAMAGEPLGQSEVTTLRLSNQCMNDSGQIAFWALLLDGTEGIYRATPISN